jgi:hypothetical protein
MKIKTSILFLTACLFAGDIFAQNATGVVSPEQSLATILSLKVAAGFGIGRARENLGTSGGDPVWWSAGQGVKLDAALDVPLLPIEVINSAGDENEPERFSIIGLEAEIASGYHVSVGGKSSSGNQTIIPTYTYIPVTIGFNTRATFGPGLPSVYIGIGGGVYWKAIYEDNITIANSSTTIKRQYDPPVPFILYGQTGLEIPLMYSPDDGNSLLDLFVQAKLSEVTNYIYDAKVTTTTPIGSTTSVQSFSSGANHTASNVAFTLGLKFNIY